LRVPHLRSPFSSTGRSGPHRRESASRVPVSWFVTEVRKVRWFFSAALPTKRFSIGRNARKRAEHRKPRTGSTGFALVLWRSRLSPSTRWAIQRVAPGQACAFPCTVGELFSGTPSGSFDLDRWIRPERIGFPWEQKAICAPGGRRSRRGVKADGEGPRRPRGSRSADRRGGRSGGA
jgi:hypothetical protein